jgi:hypothetical protein
MPATLLDGTRAVPPRMPPMRQLSPNRSRLHAPSAAALRHPPRASAWVRRAARVLPAACLATAAHAVPSYARQTGADCGACHVGAYGPQLTPYGIRFKMGGYVDTDGQGTKVPLSAMLVGNYTRTSKGASPADTVEDFNNNNVALQEASVFVAGRLMDNVGTFTQVTYSGVDKVTSLDQLDLRWARTVTIADQESTVGVSLNNNPTLTDPFNTLGQWRFPYTASDFGAGYGASPLIESLAGGVVGINPYLFYDKVYAEFGLYTGLSQGTTDFLNTDYAGKFKGPAPYWRLAWFDDRKRYNWQVGLSGLYAGLYPDPGDRSASDTYTDLGVDAQVQFLGTREHIFTGTASFYREWQTLGYTQGVLNEASNRSASLNQFRLAASYNWKQTLGATAGWFHSSGSSDALRYGSSLDGSPNTDGYIVQFDYTPWGKEDSWGAPWANLRLGLQYTGYNRFMGGSSYLNGDGQPRQASDNNTLMVFVWVAL